MRSSGHWSLGIRGLVVQGHFRLDDSWNGRHRRDGRELGRRRWCGAAEANTWLRDRSRRNIRCRFAIRIGWGRRRACHAGIGTKCLGDSVQIDIRDRSRAAVGMAPSSRTPTYTRPWRWKMLICHGRCPFVTWSNDFRCYQVVGSNKLARSPTVSARARIRQGWRREVR